jgi:hypothetical protein
VSPGPLDRAALAEKMRVVETAAERPDVFTSELTLCVLAEGLAFGDGVPYDLAVRRSDLGYFDLETQVLEPLENPFGPRVLPM